MYTGWIAYLRNAAFAIVGYCHRRNVSNIGPQWQNKEKERERVGNMAGTMPTSFYLVMSRLLLIALSYPVTTGAIH